MTLALPLALVAGLTARCADCAAPCQGTLRAPSRLVPLVDDEGGVYAREEGRVLCRACHEAVWTAHMAAVRERLALIALSEQLGYPARRADLARARAAIVEAVALVLL